MRREPIAWREVIMPRPLDEATATEGMRHLADTPAAPFVTFEARGTAGTVRLLVGSEATKLARIEAGLGATFVEPGERVPVTTARGLEVVPRDGEIASDAMALSTAELYRALAATRTGETLVLQVILGRPLRGRKQPTSEASSFWCMVLTGDNETAAGSQNQRGKWNLPGFEATVRLGVVAGHPARRKYLLTSLYGALRRMETPGVKLRLTPATPAALDDADVPWRLPLRLSIREVAAIAALPVGEELAGMPPLHPKLLASEVPLAKPGRGTLVLAEATSPARTGFLTLDVDAILRGLHLLGPIGVGKSEAIAQLALQWGDQGRTVVVVEPKRDLSDAVASRLSPEARQRVVYVDLLSPDGVVGFNPLRTNGRPVELVVDELVNIFATVLSDVIGITTRDLLNASLLTLARYPDATLLMLPLLLSNPTFRRKAVAHSSGDFFLTSYWAEFDAKSEDERAQLVKPVLTRLRQVLLRSDFRACLGQAHPKFDVRDVFGKDKKILLVPLPEAQLGKEGVQLFGSLVMHAVFGAVRERATWPPVARHPVMVVVDEWHRFVHGSEGFDEALTLFRGYGAGFVLANQVFEQLPPKLQAIAKGTVRSHVYFQLEGDDATKVARYAPLLEAVDFMSLDPFSIYAALFVAGKTRRFASGRTIQLPAPRADIAEVRADSQRRYGIPRQQVAEELARLYGVAAEDTAINDDPEAPPGRIGRRPTNTTKKKKGDET